MESMASNHAFLDGNKRASVAVVDTFLQMNGYFLELEALSAHKFITEAIAKRDFRVPQIRDWIRKHARPLTDQD